MNMAEFNRMNSAMRNDAMRRRREMYSRTGERPPVKDVHTEESIKQEHKRIPEKSMHGAAGRKPNQGMNPINNILSGIFSDGKVDNEKLLLIGLAFILAKEGADIKLLIALGYIML